jgi:phenylacetate-CoA ligase
MLVTIAELRTPEMTRRLQEAFGVHPFDAYGCTEGLWGSECEHHQGIHLFEDSTLVENVDADGQPVAAGQPGARLLVTNLYNLVQPLLRLEVTDLVTLDPDPCRCGRILVRASAIHGRSDDVLSLAARDGGRVAVHPLQFALLTRDPQVREFQVVQTARSCASSSSPATRRQPATTHWRPASARPSPSNSTASASRTHKSPSSAAPRSPARPAASSSS